jgi:hypothetical protein
MIGIFGLINFTIFGEKHEFILDYWYSKNLVYFYGFDDLDTMEF